MSTPFKTIRTEAIILLRTNIGEADRMLQILTPLGKKSAIAKGVRRQKSKLAGGLELFTVCDVVLGEAKSGLFVVTSARTRQNFLGIVSDFTRLEFGYEMIKHVSRGSEHIDEPEWFDLLKNALESLQNSALDIRLVASWFWVQLGLLSGHEIQLDYSLDGKKLSAHVSYGFDPVERGFFKKEGGDVGANHLKILRLLSQKRPEVVAQIGGISQYFDAVSHIARTAIL